jgi:hypothetical protein
MKELIAQLKKLFSFVSSFRRSCNGQRIKCYLDYTDMVNFSGCFELLEKRRRMQRDSVPNAFGGERVVSTLSK